MQLQGRRLCHATVRRRKKKKKIQQPKNAASRTGIGDTRIGRALACCDLIAAVVAVAQRRTARLALKQRMESLTNAFNPREYARLIRIE